MPELGESLKLIGPNFPWLTQGLNSGKEMGKTNSLNWPFSWKKNWVFPGNSCAWWPFEIGRGVLMEFLGFGCFSWFSNRNGTRPNGKNP